MSCGAHICFVGFAFHFFRVGMDGVGLVVQPYLEVRRPGAAGCDGNWEGRLKDAQK